MKKFSNLFTTSCLPEDRYITEMATVGRNVKLGAQRYRIACHGTDSFERPNPYIHIYLADDIRPFNKFNFEISICDILCKDEINIVKMRDKQRHIEYGKKEQCSWKGYGKLRADFEKWLFDTTPSIKGDFIDNLDACIYWYNQESTSKSTNAIKDYIESQKLVVLPKYEKYVNN